MAAQLERFRSAYDYMVAGHAANLDFWLGEVERAVAAIDGYPERFRQLADAQREWIERHHVVVGTTEEAPAAPALHAACERLALSIDPGDLPP